MIMKKWFACAWMCVFRYLPIKNREKEKEWEKSIFTCQRTFIFLSTTFNPSNYWHVLCKLEHHNGDNLLWLAFTLSHSYYGYLEDPCHVTHCERLHDSPPGDGHIGSDVARKPTPLAPRSFTIQTLEAYTSKPLWLYRLLIPRLQDC